MEKKIIYLFIFVFTAGIIQSQEIISVEPNEALLGEELAVTISGQDTHFEQATWTLSVWFQQGSETIIYPWFNTVYTDTLLDSYIYVEDWYPTGYYDLNIYSNIDGYINLDDAFYVLPNPDLPHLEYIAPNYASQGDALTVAIGGENTDFGMGTSTTQVWFTQGSGTTIYADSVMVNDEESLEAEFHFTNLHNTGLYDVNVYTWINGWMRLFDGFYLFEDPTPPAIVSIEPDHASPGETLDVQITGQNTNFGQGSGTVDVWFSQGTSTTIIPRWVDILSETTLNTRIQFPEYENPGYYDLHVSSYLDGQLLLENGFNLTNLPDQPEMPKGITEVCTGTLSYYIVTEAEGATAYNWTIEPYYAGSLSVDMNTTMVYWSEGYEGETQIKVEVANEYGWSDFSEPLDITVGNGSAIADFEYEVDGLEITFINTSSYAYEFFWSFGDGTESFDLYQTIHEYAEDGSYTVQLIAGGDVCGEDTTQKEITVHGSYVSLFNGGKEKVFFTPNPSNGLFHIAYDQVEEEMLYLDIFNINGQKIHSSEIPKNSTKILDLTEHEEGVYFYKIQGNRTHQIGKLIIH